MNEDQLRKMMVQTQIERRGIKNQRILNAFLTTPRHEFVPKMVRSMAYLDRPLPIGEGQTISQPYIVALMTEMINPQPQEIVLEVGTGSGYQAAILSHLVKQVYSIERHHSLYQNAKRTIKRLTYTNIEVFHGDGSQGLPDQAPFDAILLTAAAPKIPAVLLQQTRLGGKIIAPIGSQYNQMLIRWVKTGADSFITEESTQVAFVPLRGKYGWGDSDWPETD